MEPENLTKEDLEKTITALDGLKDVVFPAMNSAGYRSVYDEALKTFTHILEVAKIACALLIESMDGDSDAEDCV
jgi:hypothetical protein